MKPIRYEDYESITDTIFYASNLQLQFSVKLYNKDMNGNRRSIYGETLYNTSSKYKDNYEVRKINRKIYCNLVLGNIRDTDFYKKDNVFITYQDMILLRQTLNSVANNVIKNATQLVFKNSIIASIYKIPLLTFFVFIFKIK